jgi:photosystem II stability/assembly factor-like uncharacterized protein
MNKFCFGGILVLLLCWSSALFAADWEIIWEPERPFSSCIFAVDFVNAKDGWMTGAYNVILHTDDGGITWREQDSGIMKVSKWYDVSFISTTQGWIGGYYRVDKQGQSIYWYVILHTTNGGTTWNVQKRVDDLPLIIQFFNTKEGIGVSGSGVFFRTMDGGETWEENPQRLWGGVHGGYFLNINEGWVVGSGALHTTDGGKTWKQNQMVGGDEAYFINPKEGWIGGEEGQIFHTTDGGTTWQQHWLQECPFVGGIYFANGREGWVVGGRRSMEEEFGVILHTTDSGTTWEIQSRIDDYLVDICSDGAGHLWAVGSHGTVLAYFDPNLVSVVPANMKVTGWGNVKRGVE